MTNEEQSFSYHVLADFKGDSGVRVYDVSSRDQAITAARQDGATSIRAITVNPPEPFVDDDRRIF